MHAVSLGHGILSPLWLGLESGRKFALPLGLVLCKAENMKKATSAKQKIRGRPATGVTPMMGFRASDKLRAEIVRWAEYQPDTPKLSEAVRRLVEMGLASASPQNSPRVLSTAKQSAARALELAGNAIDKHSDQNASEDERKVRSRKLIQAPSVFRDARKDRPGK
jgi:hypothetical protein